MGTSVSHHSKQSQDFLHFLEIIRQHYEHSQHGLDLSPNQSWPSQLSRLTMASPLQKIYWRKFSNQTMTLDSDFAEMIERELQSLATEVFRMPFAHVGFSSGTQANFAACQAVLKPGDSVVVADLSRGGHETHQARGMLRFYEASTIALPFLSSWEIDLKGLEKVLEHHRPRLLILGSNPMLFPLPLSDIKRLCQKFETKLMYDMSAVSALIAAEQFQPEAPQLADLLTSSTCKSLHGPRHGLILYQDSSYEDSIEEAANYLNASTPVATMAALGMALSEVKTFGRDYAQQSLKNAQALAQALKNFGFQVLFEDRDFTASDALMIEFEEGATALSMLEQAGISSSLIALPEHFSNYAEAIVLSSSVMTRRGMKESEMEWVAEAMSRVLIHQEDPARVRMDITRELTNAFQHTDFSFDQKFSLDQVWQEQLFTIPMKEFQDVKDYAMTLAPLSDLPRDLLDQIANSLKIIQLRPHQTLFQAQDEADSIYFVARGEMELWDENTNPRQLVATIPPGDSLGQKELLLQENWFWTARSKGSAILLKLSAPVFLDLLDRSAEFRAHFSKLEKSIRTQQKIYQHTARYEFDSLTGMRSRKAFQDFTEFELHRARRQPKQGLSIAYLDLKRFKEFNEKWGQKEGDEILKTLSQVLENMLRKSDTAARLEGDNFAILMPATDAKSAKIASDRLSRALKQAIKDHHWPIEFNMALITFRSPPKTAAQAMDQAYHLMGDLKKSGKAMMKHEIMN